MYDQQLVQCLMADSPQSVALIGEPIFRLAQAISDSPQGATAPEVLKSPSIEAYVQAAPSDDRDATDRAICMHLPNNAAKPEISLGLACRHSPHLLLVEHVQINTGGELLDDEQFYAFGFRCIQKNTYNSGMKRKLFAYRLSDYKQAPTWLNARFWAHPERFDQQD